ncbi:MAG TPA: zinc-binding alcohol dehydrogenase [Arsenicitalea sp.]|jgi:NADPH:quinone reductase-like Zn-dependent oxidoreductase|nr:zinc-binding alcohol dehydrogenase [Arsenicitalea sp.]
MSDHRRIRSLGVEREGQPYFFEYDEAPPQDGEVRLDGLFSGFSAGTELTFLKQSNPFFHASWDGERNLFREGEPSLRYPVPFLGYMEVARVRESRNEAFVEGQILATTFAHKTGHIANPSQDLLLPVPQDIDPILGIFIAQMGPIAANGILHADAELFGPRAARLGQGVAGRPVLVFGAGTVGFLTALFAVRSGAAAVVIADPSEFRRRKAETLGITAMTEAQAVQHAKSLWHHGGADRGADFVFQTRADPHSLGNALRALRPQGTVIDLAFYQGGAEAVRLGEEFHHNGLAVRSAQISRMPRGLSHNWDRRRLALETIELLQLFGAEIRSELITHVTPIEDAPAFLRQLIAERPEFVQIVFQVGQP